MAKGKPYYMPKVSKGNKYHTTDGESITQGQFNYRLTQAKALKLQLQRDEHGYNFCEECAEKYLNGDTSINVNACIPVDCSHDISVKWCKENGCIERAYDINEITLRGRPCHQKLDGLAIAKPPKLES